MEILEYNGEDFKAVFTNENFKIGLLRYSERFSKLCCFERHFLTDEAFALLSGTATFYTFDGQAVKEYKMEQNKVYVAHKNEWHHIVVSPDATVIVFENADTSKENTEKFML